MTKLLEITWRPGFILGFRIFGFIMMLAGLLAASLNLTFGGFAPMYWFFLAFASFLGAICNTLFRIRALLEKKSVT
jgi:hypothetical protein